MSTCQYGHLHVHRVHLQVKVDTFQQVWNFAEGGGLVLVAGPSLRKVRRRAHKGVCARAHATRTCKTCLGRPILP